MKLHRRETEQVGDGASSMWDAVAAVAGPRRGEDNEHQTVVYGTYNEPTNL